VEASVVEFPEFDSTAPDTVVRATVQIPTVSAQSSEFTELSNSGISESLIVEETQSVQSDLVEQVDDALFINAGFFDTEEDAEALTVHLDFQNNLLSEFLENRRQTAVIGMASGAIINMFDESIDLAALFSTTQGAIPGMLSSLSESFDQQQEELQQSAAASRFAVGTSATITSGISVGYFLYLLRGGAIMSSMMASLPAWRFVDPLPILNSLDAANDDDQESLETIISSK